MVHNPKLQNQSIKIKIFQRYKVRFENKNQQQHKMNLPIMTTMQINKRAQLNLMMIVMMMHFKHVLVSQWDRRKIFKKKIIKQNL